MIAWWATLGLAAPSRVVVLSDGLVETTFALGAGDVVVGVDRDATFPPEATALPRVGSSRQLSAEGLLSARPDLVVLPEDAGPASVVDQLRAAGVAVATMPTARDAEGLRARVLALGEALERPAEAEALAGRLEEALAAVRPATGAPKVLFVYARGSGTLLVAGRDTAADAMIALAGARSAVSSWDGYRPLTPEAVVAAAPDVILLTEAGLASIGGVESLLAMPGVGATPAGRERRVVAVDDALLLSFGPRTPAGVEAVARAVEERP
ncbi:MAG: ABC transporter substrate-binding protein [Alphaproteobacteria bacterium]|nr:ABC transporter substrate-binding protein [Alphaproteobacteria bacterium]